MCETLFSEESSASIRGVSPFKKISGIHGFPAVFNFMLCFLFVTVIT